MSSPRIVCAAMRMDDGLIVTGVRHYSPDMRAARNEAERLVTSPSEEDYAIALELICAGVELGLKEAQKINSIESN